MRLPSPIVLAVILLAGMIPLTLHAQDNYLKNTDLKDGLTGWQGDGEATFLHSDGTEGLEGDKDVIPVIKITLSKGGPRAVYQKYETRNNPNTEHISVEVYASSDFKRSTFISDFTPNVSWSTSGVFYRWNEVTPNFDFWIRGAPGFIYKVANLTPGDWVTVNGVWNRVMPAVDRTVWFFVPPGEGTVYIKNPSATP
jgi:hypothetical protein